MLLFLGPSRGSLRRDKSTRVLFVTVCGVLATRSMRIIPWHVQMNVFDFYQRSEMTSAVQSDWIEPFQTSSWVDEEIYHANTYNTGLVYP